ncbi:hypothetical protein BKA91DRAFT_146665 [Yarrowia lipolytica]|nr:hypothetical protein BKA91DRAFT_146665 [Yarrowia lipolytica]KAE8173854.1 hypothetical protein BKA90DRAFT_145255 [Yarrowia lipolytica]RMI95840.1 hypothetical protein BD777DRAFT_160307 [Yarrowia lipolytica]
MGLKARFPAITVLSRLRHRVADLTETAPQWNFFQLILLVQLLIFLDLGVLFKTISEPQYTYE